jgi:hypothetical protein
LTAFIELQAPGIDTKPLGLQLVVLPHGLS